MLAVGERELDDEALGEDELDCELELLGLVGLRDPLRATAADSIRRAREAGLSVAILTGDHPMTAAAIGRALDLPETSPLTGQQLESLNDGELAEATRQHSGRKMCHEDGAKARKAPSS